ncbi:hypothetical protein [Leuconostoc gasicomitatum]|nr:hypothetical protein [Leuconostoc gasicomitatum]
MEPDKDLVIQKLLQQNANLTLAKAQLEAIIEQLQTNEKVEDK